MKVFLEHRGSTNFSQKFKEQSRDQDFFTAISPGIYKNTRAEAKCCFSPASDSANKGEAVASVIRAAIKRTKKKPSRQQIEAELQEHGSGVRKDWFWAFAKH